MTPEEAVAEQRAFVQSVMHESGTDGALDTLLMMAKIFEYRANMCYPGTPMQQWFIMTAGLLRGVLRLSTNLLPDGPKPDVAYENTALYWEDVDIVH